MNTLGLTAAVCAYLAIWFGHVAVRKIEYISPTIWLPALIFSTVGLAMEWLSVATTHRQVSIILGIMGITLLFDALEFFRQQNRIRRGHAPANLHNPRHVKILAGYPAATTADPLNQTAFNPDD